MGAPPSPLALALAFAALWLWAGAAAARAQPVELAAPYEYLGWGDPQPPAEVLGDSGLHDSHAGLHPQQGRACNPSGTGTDRCSAASIRRRSNRSAPRGGEVDVSFGGWSGKKLGNACNTAAALAGAYEKVIDAYSLNAIDIDIEHNELRSKKVRQRVVEALALVRDADPGVEISITFPSSQSGPEASGAQPDRRRGRGGAAPGQLDDHAVRLRAAASGSMAAASIQALEALARGAGLGLRHLRSRRLRTGGDLDHERRHRRTRRRRVGEQDFAKILAFAGERHLARVSFWSVNRDRPCGGGAPEEECSGIPQAPLAFSALLAGYSRP